VLGACIVVFALGAGCRAPMSKIEALRDALAGSDPSAISRTVAALPGCSPDTDDASCLDAIASTLGSSRGFQAHPPDHAAAATVAVVVLRDRRGDRVGAPDDWLYLLADTKGPGVDTLRLAVVRAMSDGLPQIGRRLDSPDALRAAMRVVAESIPGACPRYRGRSPPASSDAGAQERCVERDLGRLGPSSSERSTTGDARAAAGAVGLWRATVQALRRGVPQTAPSVRPAFSQALAGIEHATDALVFVPPADLARRSTVPFGDEHLDAGVSFWPEAGVGKK
jgi:hypothetical protein